MIPYSAFLSKDFTIFRLVNLKKQGNIAWIIEVIPAYKRINPAINANLKCSK
tara:strand:+ start:94 stop:249 length:156 start_codon:yes stop_codon:yes gene_type:complete